MGVAVQRQRTSEALGEREDAADGAAKARRHHHRPAVRHGRAGVHKGCRSAKGGDQEPRTSTLLCVLGRLRAFDPAVLGSTDEYAASPDGGFDVAAERKLGRIPVLLVRMNADLVMGEELKKTGAGNLFTVFGEPDIDDQGRGHLAAGAPQRRRCLRPEHRGDKKRRHQPDPRCG